MYLHNLLINPTYLILKTLLRHHACLLLLRLVWRSVIFIRKLVFLIILLCCVILVLLLLLILLIFSQWATVKISSICWSAVFVRLLICFGYSLSWFLLLMMWLVSGLWSAYRKMLWVLVSNHFIIRPVTITIIIIFFHSFHPWISLFIFIL